MGERENGRARETRERCLSPRVSPSRAPLFSRAHYFQATTQATTTPFRVNELVPFYELNSCLLA